MLLQRDFFPEGGEERALSNKKKGFRGGLTSLEGDLMLARGGILIRCRGKKYTMEEGTGNLITFYP